MLSPMDDYPLHPTDPQNADHADTNVQLGGVGFTYNVYWNTALDYPIDNTATIRVILVWSERAKQRTASVEYAKLDPFDE